MADKSKFKNSMNHALSSLFVEEEPESIAQQTQPSVSVEAVLEEMNNSPQEEHQDIKEVESEEEKLHLEPGKTLLGTKRITDGKESKIISIYYGNCVEPPLTQEDHYIPLKEKVYLEILNAFLDSEQGRAYERPNEEQIKADSEEVARIINLHLKNEKARGSSNLLQPGRSSLLTVSKKKNDPPLETQKGQPEKEYSFADDILEREQAAVDVIKGEQNSIKAAKKLLKDMDTSRRMSTAGIVGIILVSLAVLVFAVFLIKDLIIRAHALIELELKQNEITIRAGDAFNPSDYVKYVTEDESVYIIYPSLDTEDVGEHSLDFVATNGIKNVRKTMIVNVIDGDSPTIILTDEEIKLVRNRDEETFDALKYVKEVHDNIDPDEDLYVEVNPIDWEKDEQSLSYRVKDSSGNTSKAVLLVKIEDKAVCDKNAVYNSASNTCSCKSGYSGDGIACKLIQSSSGGTAASGSGNSSGSGGTGSSGNTGGSSSSSSSSSSESYTIDYEDYQPGNGQYDVTITDNNTGESTTVTTEDPPMPGASDDEFFDWINDQLP